MSQLYVDNIKNRTGGAGGAGTPSSGNGGSGICIVRYLSE